MLGSLAILGDVLQLHDLMLVLDLFVTLLQIPDNPLGPLQIERQGLDIRLLLLDGTPKFGTLHICIIIMNEDEVGILFT